MLWIDAGWTTYLSVQAEVAATLTGLVFVAVSINLSRILSTVGLTGRAAESLLQLFGVVIIAGTALIPRQSPAALGAEILIIDLLFWVIQTISQIRYLANRKGHPRLWLVSRIIQTQSANVPFCVAGILLVLGWPVGLYWLAAGFAFSLISGVVGAWVLLIEILR